MSLLKLSGFSGDIRENEALAKHTYYRIGGPARLLVQPKSWDDLKIIKQALKESSMPYFIMGKGSNLLVADQGFSGLVIKTDKLNLGVESKALKQENQIELCIGTSVVVSSLLRRAAREGWAGLDFLTGVPGSIGGVVFMNAGTHLGEAKDRLSSVLCFDIEGQTDELWFSGTQLLYQYRSNHFLKPSHLVYSATWKVHRGQPERVAQEIDEVLQRRKASQPLEHPSCGSVFKNPREKGLRSWEVLDRLGLRGFKIGGAQFSEKHPNFILNTDHAKASDVKELIELAKSRALKELNIALHEEVRYLGFE